ncbi:50S ribosome-binding GTPase [Alloalcanivorax xenomutans]|jgi:uncharacterized protein|uniref:GTPase family protein n=1 Tax=Alloalcanivorax xenomutans TaxID=1094342 RepID=UPI003A801E2F
MDSMLDIIKARPLPLEQLRRIRDDIRDDIRATKINVLLVGGTGVGKSSTINALFENNGLEATAEIGQSAKPETMDISAHEMDNLIIWDTPGLGDSPEKDRKHQNQIISLLQEKDDKGQPLIDLVFLILDAGSRDFSSAFTLIKDIVLPNLHHDDRDRLLIGLNQADQAMKGHYWDRVNNRPENNLIERLEELVKTVKDRIKADTDLNVEPIYYSAGCVMDGEVLSHPYNLQKLLSFIMDRLPKKKRAAIALHINEDEKNFEINDDKENYREKVEKSILSSLLDYIKEVSSEVFQQVKEIATDPDNIKTALTLTARFLGNIARKK